MIESIAALLERWARLSREAQELLCQSPDCYYQDTDSVCLRDTPASRELMKKVKRRLRRLEEGLP
jgi:hypothetical protein